MPLAAGTRLGPYDVLGLIGAGGMGEVYKARDTRLDRTVAIKILPAELSADPERRARFEREARAIAALAHPHICTLYDIGRRHDGPADAYLVMEHLAGEIARRAPAARPAAARAGARHRGADRRRARRRAQARHRPPRPEARQRDADDGRRGRRGAREAARLRPGEARRPWRAPGARRRRDRRRRMAAPVTAEGTILGTLQYMAPEQLEGKEADARTDLWALGRDPLRDADGQAGVRGRRAR